MPRDRSTLGTPLGVDGPWLAAILDVLDGLHDLLEERLPAPTPARPVAEPAPAVEPKRATPVSEPAPARAPSDDEDDEPMKVAEPAPDGAPITPVDDLPAPPPRVGRGSSEQAWRRWAVTAGVDVDAARSRDDIVAACLRAGVISK